jgi:periplasmic protein TonB
MAIYAHDSGYLSRRGIAFVGIIVIHAFLIWAFVEGFAITGVRYVQTILQTNIIQTEKPKDLPPPPPPVDLKERPPVQVIAPDINISVPVDTPPPIQQVTTERVAPVAPTPRAIVPGTPVKITYMPDVNSQYPETSRRNGEEGRAIVKICVNAAGKIESTDLATPSGFPLLDEAALKVAKQIRFKPATSEGKPVESCPTLPIKFTLKGGG